MKRVFGKEELVTHKATKNMIKYSRYYWFWLGREIIEKFMESDFSNWDSDELGDERINALKKFLIKVVVRSGQAVYQNTQTKPAISSN